MLHYLLNIDTYVSTNLRKVVVMERLTMKEFCNNVTKYVKGGSYVITKYGKEYMKLVPFNQGATGEEGVKLEDIMVDLKGLGVKKASKLDDVRTMDFSPTSCSISDQVIDPDYVEKHKCYRCNLMKESARSKEVFNAKKKGMDVYHICQDCLDEENV